MFDLPHLLFHFLNLFNFRVHLINLNLLSYFVFGLSRLNSLYTFRLQVLHCPLGMQSVKLVTQSYQTRLCGVATNVKVWLFIIATTVLYLGNHYSTTLLLKPLMTTSIPLIFGTFSCIKVLWLLMIECELSLVGHLMLVSVHGWSGLSLFLVLWLRGDVCESMLQVFILVGRLGFYF